MSDDKPAIFTAYQQKRIELQTEQNAQLKRIADALEKVVAQDE